MVKRKQFDREHAEAVIAGKTGKADASMPQSAFAYVPPPSRRGRAGLTTYHEPTVLQQLREIAVQNRTTQQKLVAEGLNYVFEKYGRPKIAEG
jgi:hypothetical protein